MTTVTTEDYDRSKFEHEFQGFSIWLEPEETESLSRIMSDLQNECGGPAAGVYAFVPHITILYNIDIPPLLLDAVTTDNSHNAAQSLQQCLKRLAQEYDEYSNNSNSNFQEQEPQPQKQELWNDNEPTDSEEMATAHSPTSAHHFTPTTAPRWSLTASDWYHLHYPKSADNGKGFGCDICLLLIQPTSWLDNLWTSCCQQFGIGERSNFIPHLSVVYAPESRGPFLKAFVERQQAAEKQQQLLESIVQRGGYLSLWSTQGPIQDWHRIAKIPLL